MCWRIKTPSVSTAVPASTLAPQTNAPTPDSAEFGGSEDTFKQKKGRKQLTIDRNSSFNPTNY